MSAGAAITCFSDRAKRVELNRTSHKERRRTDSTSSYVKPTTAGGRRRPTDQPAAISPCMPYDRTMLVCHTKGPIHRPKPTPSAMFKRPKNRDKALKAKARVMRKQRSDSPDNDEAQEDAPPPARDVPDESAPVPDASNGAAAVKKEEDGASSNDNDNNDDEEEEGSTLDRIIAAKKKRKLKNALMRSQPSGLKKRRIVAKKEEDDLKGEEEGDEDGSGGAAGGGDLGQRLKGTFGGGADTSSGPDGGAGGEGEGVLGKKHRAAMERYIQDRMGDDNDGDSPARKNGSGGGKQEGGTMSADVDEDALYRQVAAEVGAAGIAGPADDLDDAEKAGEAAPASAKEDDVGAGGMMLAGTGIAEISLPVDERIRTVRETELLASSSTRERMAAAAPRTGGGTGGGGRAPPRSGPGSARDLERMLPTSFGKKKGAKEEKIAQTIPPTAAVPTQPMAANSDASTAIPVRGPGGKIASSAGTAALPTDVANLSQSYSHNFKMHTHQWVSDRKTEQQREIDRVRKEQEERDGTVENQSRVGFDQARRVARGEVPAGAESSSSAPSSARRTGPAGSVGAGGDRNRSSDDRVWRSFVSKSRNRR